MVRGVMPALHIDRFLPSAWFLTLSAFGGASRHDEWQQVIVVMASVIVLVGALWTPNRSDVRSKGALWLFLAAVAALICLQLVPLPPSFWSRLPGREPFLLGAQLTGLDNVWRPITLTPELTWASLFSLLPVAATLAVAPTAKSAAVRPLIWTMIGVFSVAAFLGLGQSLGSELTLYRIANVDSAIGVFANRNHHAIFLSLAFPIIALLLSTERPKNASPAVSLSIAASVGLLYAASIIQAGSRSGLVLCALTLGTLMTAAARGYFPMAMPITNRRTTRPALHRDRRLIVTIGAVSAVALVGVSMVVMRSVAFQRLLLSDVTYEARAQNLPVFIKMTESFLPFGSGFGSFSAVFRHFEPFDNLSYTYLNQSHNDIIQAVIEGGLPALALIIVAIAGWIFQTLRIVRTPSALERQVGVVGCVIVLVIFLASLIDYPLRTPLLGAMLVFGAVFMLRDRASKSLGTADGGLLSKPPSHKRQSLQPSEEIS